MIGKGPQYGYVRTAEAVVFLRIADDPSTVYYSVCVPKLDVMDDDEARLHRTAVAHVLTFIVQAIGAPPPPQSWFDGADRLDTWAVEYDDVLRDIPESVRKNKTPRSSPHEPQRWEGIKRSQSPTHSTRSRPDDANSGGPEAEQDDDSCGRGQGEQGQQKISNIQGRSFCSQLCLLDLAQGRPMDEQCPNAHERGERHISPSELL